MTADAIDTRRWVGRPLLRVEDPALLQGAGCFVDDHPAAGALHGAFVRSPVASARIDEVDAEAALALPGVRFVLTAQDLEGVRGLRAVLHNPGFVPTEMPLLADGVVRHVGEPVALVLADDPYVAEDAADAVDVRVTPGEPVATMAAAIRPQAPQVHEEAPGNLLLDVVLRDDSGIDEALAAAHLVLEERFTSARVNAVPLEGRACLAQWDERDQRVTLYTSTQMPHLVRSTVAELVGIPERQVRVVAPDVGGGFGQKCVVAREEVLLAAVAVRLQRAVKWTEDRSENLTANFSGHEQEYRVRAGFYADGRLVALDAEIDCDVGAYSCYPMTCGVEPLMAAAELPGVYRFQHYRVRARGIATNKPAMSPYRGVSRPQQVLVMERLMDKAARRLGGSVAEIRFRNLLTRNDFPFRGLTGFDYDEGSYRESLERCLDMLGFDDWADRQRRAREEGRLLGLGLSCFSERTGYGTPVFAGRRMAVTPGFENADVRMDADGGVTVALGTSGHGQGHRTTLAQIVADELGVAFDDVRVVHGDTDATPFGWGTFASRTAVIGGGACKRAAALLATKLRAIGAQELDCDPDDVELAGGCAVVRAAPDRRVAVKELARLAHQSAHRLPKGHEAGLTARATFDPPGTFSNATHGAIVEVSQDTGAVTVRRFVVVEDCGVMLNPLVVEGQVRGGVAQGIAVALYEQLVFDESGQCLTGSLMDYLVPTCAEIPAIEISHIETPSRHSETGAKGLGEGGTIGAPAAIANAVSDALAHLGVDADDLPIRPDRLLAAITAGNSRDSIGEGR